MTTLTDTIPVPPCPAGCTERRRPVPDGHLVTWTVNGATGGFQIALGVDPTGSPWIKAGTGPGLSRLHITAAEHDTTLSAVKSALAAAAGWMGAWNVYGGWPHPGTQGDENRSPTTTDSEPEWPQGSLFEEATDG